MTGASQRKLDPHSAQAEEIAQRKDDDLAYYAALPVQKLAADFIGRDPDTVRRWQQEDPEFGVCVSRAKAEWAKKKAGRVKEEFLLERVLKEEFSPRQELTGKDGGALELGIAGIVREAAQHTLEPQPESSHEDPTN